MDGKGFMIKRLTWKVTWSTNILLSGLEYSIFAQWNCFVNGLHTSYDLWCKIHKCHYVFLRCLRLTRGPPDVGVNVRPASQTMAQHLDQHRFYGSRHMGSGSRTWRSLNGIKVKFTGTFTLGRRRANVGPSCQTVGRCRSNVGLDVSLKTADVSVREITRFLGNLADF